MGDLKFRRAADVPESLICCPSKLLSTHMELQLFSEKLLFFLKKFPESNGFLTNSDAYVCTLLLFVVTPRQFVTA